jgi:predicted DNA-binding protein (MmcQ/YjbR family)
MTTKTDALLAQIKAFGLQYPGAHIRSPWPDHADLAVKDKTFAWLSIEGEPFSIGCKLPFTGPEALDLPYSKPTGYGLGRSGWVTLTPDDDELPSFAQLKSWIDESYRAVAPKTLVKAIPPLDLG